MSLFSKSSRHKTPYRAVTDEERIARYVYLLNTLPADVIEDAHTTAFRRLPPEPRREMFEKLIPFMSDEERAAASDDPSVLARAVRRAEEQRATAEFAAAAADSGAMIALTTGTAGDRRGGVDSRAMMLDAGVMVTVAQQVIGSVAVARYFSTGDGSMELATQPEWLIEAFARDATGYDNGYLGSNTSQDGGWYVDLYGGGWGGRGSGGGYGEGAVGGDFGGGDGGG